jgi:hypothetical protein
MESKEEIFEKEIKKPLVEALRLAASNKYECSFFSTKKGGK